MTANPTVHLTTDLSVADPTAIDWPTVQANAWIPFRVVNRRPVNPFSPTLVCRGRNRMRHWSERKCADGAVTCTVNGTRYVLLIENDRGWGLPGGGLKHGEGVRDGCSREVFEETGLPVDPDRWERVDRPRYMRDPRASNEAWNVTVVCHVWLGVLTELPALTSGSDAYEAAWAQADTYVDLVDDVAGRFGGVLQDAHRFLLADVLQAPVPDLAPKLLVAS